MLQDVGAPYTVDKSYNGLSFKAKMAQDDHAAKSLVSQPGADGFSFDSSPLFQVNNYTCGLKMLCMFLGKFGFWGGSP